MVSHEEGLVQALGQHVALHENQCSDDPVWSYVKLCCFQLLDEGLQMVKIEVRIRI